MKIKKDITWIIAILCFLLLAVLIRNFNRNLFKQNAAEAVIAVKSITVSADSILHNTENPFIVELDTAAGRFEKSVSIPIDQLLEKTNIEKMKAQRDSIYLYSKSIETASQAWVILNQLGFDNILILSDESDPEKFEYKFQPDTMARGKLQNGY